MMLIGFSAAFGYMMALMQIPAKVDPVLHHASPSNKYELLMLINVLLLLLGALWTWRR